MKCVEMTYANKSTHAIKAPKQESITETTTTKYQTKCNALPYLKSNMHTYILALL